MIIKYTDELKHFNPYHNKKNGRFDFSPNKITNFHTGDYREFSKRNSELNSKYSSGGSVKINYKSSDHTSGTRDVLDENGRLDFSPNKTSNFDTGDYREFSKRNSELNSKYGSGESVKINYKSPDQTSGTRENVNKYQYKVIGDDGKERYFYTDAGAKRYAIEESENNAKSKKNRLDEDALGDTNRWIRDDYDDYSNLAKNTAEAARSIGKMSDQIFNYAKKSNPRLDLSEMSDDQLRQILNRERMEQEYNNYFNQPKKSSETAQKFIKGATDFISFGGEQAALALEIVKLARSFRA